MEKDIDRIAKGRDTDIVIRIDEFNGKRGVTIREFVKSDKYSGFTKSGTRIPADKFSLFKQAINSIDEKDLEVDGSESSEVAPAKKSLLPASAKKPSKKAKNDKLEDEVEAEDVDETEDIENLEEDLEELS